MTRERKLMRLIAVIFAAVAVAGPAISFAQKSPGGVTGGARQHPGTWSNQRASRSVRHARDYSRDIYRYSRDAGRIDPAVAKSDSEELGRNIAKAKREVAASRQEAGDDAATLAALKSIDQLLEAAAKQHAMLHEECCKDAVDGSVCMKHCNQILLALDKAQAEQDALIRSTEIGTPSSAGSSAPHEHH
jgi:hypothetical protein